MPALKLAKLPDRTPVKVTVILSPALSKALEDYAEHYRESYDEVETERIVEIIPYMLQSFLDGDRSFAKARRGRGSIEKTGSPITGHSPPPSRRTLRASPSTST